MKRLPALLTFAAFLLLAATLTACEIEPTESSASSPSEEVTTGSIAPETIPYPLITTYDPNHSCTTPATTTVAVTPAPVTTTAPITTAAPVTTTAPVTTVPVTTPQPEEPALPAINKVKFTNTETIGYLTQNATVVDKKQQTDLFHLSADQTLWIIGENEHWTRIEYKGKVGYLPTSAVTKERPHSAVEKSEELGAVYYPGDDRIVVIDPGHQRKGMKDKEPNGPGSTEMKAMLSSGTQGVSTRIPEYQLNLDVALLLRDQLIARGYTVIMIREVNEVTLSNAQRAVIANHAQAGAFVRIHANGSSIIEDRGAFTICQTPINPYNGDLYRESYRLSKALLDGFIDSTDMIELPIWETDTMTGINWAEVPSTIIEMGYMSNAAEDELMATDEFRQNAAIGMADGLDVYFGE